MSDKITRDEAYNLYVKGKEAFLGSLFDQIRSRATEGYSNATLDVSNLGERGLTVHAIIRELEAQGFSRISWGNSRVVIEWK